MEFFQIKAHGGCFCLFYIYILFFLMFYEMMLYKYVVGVMFFLSYTLPDVESPCNARIYYLVSDFVYVHDIHFGTMKLL